MAGEWPCQCVLSLSGCPDPVAQGAGLFCETCKEMKCPEKPKDLDKAKNQSGFGYFYTYSQGCAACIADHPNDKCYGGGPAGQENPDCKYASKNQDTVFDYGVGMDLFIDWDKVAPKPKKKKGTAVPYSPAWKLTAEKTLISDFIVWSCACEDGCGHGYKVANKGDVCDYCSKGHPPGYPHPPGHKGAPKSWSSLSGTPSKTKKKWTNWIDDGTGQLACGTCYHYKDKKTLTGGYCLCKCHKSKVGPNPTQKYLEKIGLHPKLNLKMECADFYLLEKMVEEQSDDGKFHGNEKLLAMLAEREEFLAHEFGIYLDMVCGGEARYAAAPGTGYGGDLESYSQMTQDYINSVFDIKREKVWKIYMNMRRKAPKKTLKILEEITAIFGEKWGGGAGGEPWAKIAQVVLAYKQGKMKARSFVNLSFSLQHNNDAVFDKVYDISGLARVLEVQASGHYDRSFYYGSGENGYDHQGLWLISWASPEVQVMWKNHKRERHQPQGMDVPSWHGTGD